MPPENAVAIHLLMSVHTALTLAAFLSGPIMIWRAWNDRPDRLYWAAAIYPLLVLLQRLSYGDACVVQDMARQLWQVTDPDIWAPDLYFVSQAWVTYVVDACVLTYAVGVLASVALFLRRRPISGVRLLSLERG